MSEINHQLFKDIIIQKENLYIPHPKHKNARNFDKEKKLNKSNDLLDNKKSKKGNHSFFIRANDYLKQLENGNNNIFDSLINMKKYDNKEKNCIYDEDNNINIEKKLSKAKKDMEDVKDNIDKLNKKMINIKNNLENLEIKKIKNENEMKNLISNREALEEMYNTEIVLFKDEALYNKNNINMNDFSEINISNQEIQKINVNKFIIQIMDLIKSLNNSKNEEEFNSNNSYYNSFYIKIKQIYSNFINQLNKINDENNSISLLICRVSEIVVKEFDLKTHLDVIKSLIRYLVKINFIDEQIKKCEDFIELEYKIQKEKINEETIEITMALIFYENLKHEILNLTSKIQNEINEKRKMKENIFNINGHYCLDSYEKDSDELKQNANIQKNKEIDFSTVKENKEKNTKNVKKNLIKIKTISEINLDGDKIEKDINSETDMNFIDIKKQKNKIYENYINNGINLNEKRDKKEKNNKLIYNSISIYNNKTNNNNNYNFNVDFLDIKPKKRKIEDNNKNYLVLRNIFNLNKPKKKKYNSNANLKEYISISNENKFDKIFLKTANNISQKRNKNKHINNNNMNKKIKQNKQNNTISDISRLTSYKKGNINNNKILALKKLFSRTNADKSPYEKINSNKSSSKNIRNRINNSNLILNINNNIKFDSNFSKKRIKNISNLLTDNLKDININLNNLYQTEGKNINIINKRQKPTKTTNNSKNKKSLMNNQIKTFKRRIIESFCYFKFIKINDNINKFNPLKVFSVNPDSFEYYECYISIDFTSGCLKISPKISIDKIKNIPLNNKNISITNCPFCIEIKLKNIISVDIEKYTKEIIKIQNILTKYKIKANNNFSIYTIINKKEIKEIKLEQNEKIKAVLCNFFPFSLSIKGNVIIDIIFINFEQFNIWLKNMNSITRNNVIFSKIGKDFNYSKNN